MKEYDYSSTGGYFITICTYDRGCVFGEIINEEMRVSKEGEFVKRYWMEIPDHFENIKLDEFVVMPNHVHGIITDHVGAIHESPLQMTQQQRRKMKLSKIIGRFKMMSAKEINIYRDTKGSHLWQRGYYDHIICNEKDLHNTRDYIINNPLKWSLDNENI